jgi:hypothetical protein
VVVDPDGVAVADHVSVSDHVNVNVYVSEQIPRAKEALDRTQPTPAVLVQTQQ